MEKASPEKHEYYRGGILKAYILIGSESINIEAFRLNTTGHWELEEYKTPGETLIIKAIDTAIPIQEIYEGTKLTV